MEELDYKREILESRTGSLGSSDAALVERVGRGGLSALTENDKYRLAVMLGQAERANYHTAAMELGDKIENTIFELIKRQHPQAVSNPLREDELMSRFYGFGIINHIDIEVETDKSVIWYEVKASKHNFYEVLDTYKAQLQWHWMLLKKVYAKSGKELKLRIVHYQTGMTKEFSADNLRIEDVPDNTDMESRFYQGFLLLKDFLPTYVYKAPEDFPIANVEDEQIQELRSNAEDAILKIQYMQECIDEWKDKVKQYMIANNIKKISGDNYSITLTAQSVSTTFDSKRFKAEKPEEYANYTKQVERAASVTIRVNQ
jgi:hypothetical protein